MSDRDESWANARTARETAAENERIVFGPGHSAAEVEAAAAALRDTYASRRSADSAVDDGVRQHPDATPSPRPPTDAVDATPAVDASPLQRRRWLLPAAAFAAGLLVAGIGMALAERDSTGNDTRRPDRDASTTQAGIYSSDPADVERGDPRVGARKWFALAQTPIDRLPQSAGAVDPASTRYVGSAGRVRIWIAHDDEGGYCVVTSSTSASIELSEICVTPEDFRKSGIVVLADEVYIQWSGDSVDFDVSPRD
jgi:hypothetical protein